MKKAIADKALIDSIPSNAMVFYSNRSNPSENSRFEWGDESSDTEFGGQFIGCHAETFIDDGMFDGNDLAQYASGAKCFSITLEEGEFHERGEVYAKEQMIIFWSENNG